MSVLGILPIFSRSRPCTCLVRGISLGAFKG